MGMPEQKPQNGMNITPDGMVYEILEDGNIKRIGRVSSNGEFEQFGKKKIWSCPNCGTENADADNFCGECGTKKPETSTWNCPNCGKKEIESSFCPDCGTKKPEASSYSDAAEQFSLGCKYYFGKNGVQKNYTEALKWYRKAAEQGYVKAQNNLGVMYHDGLGVPQDYKEAAKWYKKAAEQGHITSQSNLAAMYYIGEGVSKDNNEALKWYRKAAEQGDSKAQKTINAILEEENRKQNVKVKDIEPDDDDDNYVPKHTSIKKIVIRILLAFWRRILKLFRMYKDL